MPALPLAQLRLKRSIGDFTATGPMGDWTGLTTLNVNSGSNLSFVDNVTLDPTTAVNITDTTITGTSAGQSYDRQWRFGRHHH